MARRRRAYWSSRAPLPQAVRPQAADIAVEGIDGVDDGIEDPQCPQDLTDTAEADTRVSCLDLAQGVAGDARAIAGGGREWSQRDSNP